MIIKPKQYWLLFLFSFSFLFCNAQSLNWMLGTWKGTGNSRKAQFTRTLEINSVNGDEFTGIRTKEAHDRVNSKIVTSISGRINKDTFYLKDGTILFKKDPPNAKWLDCTHCIPTNRVIVTYDSVFLSSEIIGCADYCDGTSVYYKLLPDLDTATQRSLMNSFGTQEQIASFTPHTNTPPVASSDPDQVKPKVNEDSLKLVANLEKKRQQHIQDSINIAEKQQQQHIQDSITNAAITLKKRQQQVLDSTNAANAFVKKRQQQIDDSLKIATTLEKKRQQHIQDSISVVKQQQQQHIQDSITNAAIALKKRQQQVLDSTNAANAFAKKRQQQIDDSLKIVASLEKKRQQHIDDSLTNVANINKIKQQEIQDSIKIATAKKQPMPDSTKSTVAKTTADKSKLLVQRDNVLLQTYHITTPDILIELFDNAEIDGDRVSVFHNNNLIVNNQTLLREPITFKIHADTTNRTHEFILIAENLGTIPPNTALMRITVGTQVYKLSVKTDLKTNAKIDFYYDGN